MLGLELRHRPQGRRGNSVPQRHVLEGQLRESPRRIRQVLRVERVDGSQRSRRYGSHKWRVLTSTRGERPGGIGKPLRVLLVKDPNGTTGD
eukprot:UN1751